MRRLVVFGIVAALAAGAAACGGGKKDEAQQAAEIAKQAAKEIQQAASEPGGGDLAKNMQEFAKSMEELQKAPDGTAYEPVSFKTLVEFLPDVPGWEKQEPEGESMTSPVKISQASTSYTKDEARIELKIVDTAMSKLMTLPYQMFLMSGYSKESMHGYEKAVQVAGNPGWEKWDGEAKHAEIGTIVGKRFLVTIDAEGTDVKSAQAVLGKVDLGKLAGVK